MYHIIYLYICIFNYFRYIIHNKSNILYNPNILHKSNILYNPNILHNSNILYNSNISYNCHNYYNLSMTNNYSSLYSYNIFHSLFINNNYINYKLPPLLIK